jgi:hypothetical protein
MHNRLFLQGYRADISRQRKLLAGCCYYYQQN